MRFNLRTLFVIISAVILPLALIGNRYARHTRQATVIEALEQVT